MVDMENVHGQPEWSAMGERRREVDQILAEVDELRASLPRRLWLTDEVVEQAIEEGRR